MTRKRGSKTPQYLWEQALLDAYYDYRSRQILEPLYQKFQQWKAGELDHIHVNEAIHQAHKQNQDIYGFFNQTREWLLRFIPLDEAWFQAWMKDNPPPAGYQFR